MKITKDNLYEKMEELFCANCKLLGSEYFFDNEEFLLCETCVSKILKDQCNKPQKTNNSNNKNKNNTKTADKLWQEQEHFQKDKS